MTKEDSSVGVVTTMEPLSSTVRHSHLEPLHGQTVVIKYGGVAMEKPGLRDLFSRDMALVRTLGVRPVVVHGGGPQIDRMMKRLGKSPHFVGGLRVTDDDTMATLLSLTPGELAALRLALRTYVTDLQLEIGHTDSYQFREELRAERAALEGVLRRLGRAAAAGQGEAR